MRRCILILLAALLLFPLAGCWDYKGLDTLGIVSGVAIDRDELTGEYILTIELIDTQSGGNGGETNTLYVETRGETIFNAIRNGKKRLMSRLYGGNMQTMIISHQIAETEGILFIMELFLRNGEPRETMSVAISQEATARELLFSRGLDSKIIAYEIHNMIAEDNRVTASTKDIDLYQVYTQLESPGGALVLPAIHGARNHEDTVAECNGIALFKGDRLVGFDTPRNTLYYLFVTNEISGAAYAMPFEDDQAAASFEIMDSRTQTQVRMADGQAHITVKVQVKLSVTEMRRQLDILQPGQRDEAETLIGEALGGQIADYIRTVQAHVGHDIFGLGRKLYQRQPDLWQTVADDWDDYFQNAHIQVQVEAELLGFGVMKQY